MAWERYASAAFAFVAVGACASPTPQIRPFPDRAVAWQEHDDENVPEVPKRRRLERQDLALIVRDFGTREAARHLSLEPRSAGLDVNALDEVPCSTWFCPRHHLGAMSPQQVARGLPADPPRLPLTITAGKARGAAPGFKVRDAAGRAFMVKLDPAGHPELASGAEAVGSAIFHAAGYNVPGAFMLALLRSDLQIAPGAEVELSGVAARPFSKAHLHAMLGEAAQNAHGRWTAVAVPWLEGEVLGAFDMVGTRSDDPNDRFPHEDRRSLRASRVLFAWLNVVDASSLNTLDSYVEDGGRHFVRHHIFDFGAGLGSGSSRVKSVFDTRESLFELGRILAAFFSAGVYQRAWQADRALFRVHLREDAEPPALGWLYPLESFSPRAFRTNRKVPAHLRMTERDAYWGAKVVTSFSDAHLRALVDAVYSRAVDAEAIFAALKWRRDAIGRAYLLTYAATEWISVQRRDAGFSLCFQDLAITRGFLNPKQVRYDVRLYDVKGHALSEVLMRAHGNHSCVSLPARLPPYVVASIRTSWAEAVSAPTRVHLRLPATGQVRVLGVERDEDVEAY